MVAKGYTTLEALDRSPKGWNEVEKMRAQAQTPLDPYNKTQKVPWYNRDGEAYETFPLPTQKVPASRPAYRNLARDWIAANPKEWEALWAKHNSAPEPEPGVELDGVTIITNSTTPDDLPF